MSKYYNFFSRFVLHYSYKVCKLFMVNALYMLNVFAVTIGENCNTVFLL